MFKCWCWPTNVRIGLLNINVVSCPCWGSNAKVSKSGSTCILGIVSNLVPMSNSQCQRTRVPWSEHQHRNGFITSNMCTDFWLSMCQRRDLQVGWVIINVVQPRSACNFLHADIGIDKSEGPLLFLFIQCWLLIPNDPNSGIGVRNVERVWKCREGEIKPLRVIVIVK